MYDIKDIFEDIQETDKRTNTALGRVESSEYSVINAVHATSYALNAQAITDGTTYTTDSLREVNGVPVYARGVFAIIWGSSEDTDYIIQSSRSDDDPDDYSDIYIWEGAAGVDRHRLVSTMVILPLGADGAIKLKAVGTDITVTLQVIGYYT